MIRNRLGLLAVPIVIALTAMRVSAQSPSRAIGATVGAFLGGASAAIFGEGDRGYWRGHARLGAVTYAVGCKALEPCLDDKSAVTATVGASILSSPVPKRVRVFAGGAAGVARYNIGLDDYYEIWLGSDIGGQHTQFRMQIRGDFGHHPMPLIEVGIRRAF